MNNIVISNSEKFNELKKQFINDGFKNLHIVSDFDRTLTKAFIKDGEYVPSSISILRDENYLTKDYSSKSKELFKHYHAIEINNSIPLEEKKLLMKEWWTKHSELLIDSGLNLNDLEKIAKSKRIQFRDKCSDIITKLDDKKVPFIIFSASGVGDDSISKILKHHNLLKPNISIISNKYVWDKNGNPLKVIKPLIHVFNKDETSLKTSNIFPKIKNRKNVILLGDSLGDIKMAVGFEYNNLIKIGFLNSNVEENLDEYTKNYDVVITNDGSIDFLLDFLEEF